MLRVRVFTIAMVLALAWTAAAQTPQKKFMAAPVTIEDQGSFFVGGVTKVTDFAAVPFAPPGQPTPAARVHPGRPRRLVSLLRPQGRPDVRGRSIGPRPIRIRSLGPA